MTPVDYILRESKNCNMWWTHTDMLTKYALVAIIVLCITVLGFTLLVHSSLCELSIKERNIEFKAVLAYESKK
ncbi:protein hokG [Klebsiella pneumoniae]|nr:protein hokG [Klebsiella pneumoniae]